MLSAAIALVVCLCLYKGVQVIYRLYLHPLASFPGPRKAAISQKWQQSLIDNDFPEQVYERLHREYDTKVLRIGPNDLHISDPEAYKVIYNQTHGYLKDAPFYSSFQSSNPIKSIFTTDDPAYHRIRRRLMNSSFSKKGVVKVEPIINKKLDMIGAKLDKICGNRPLDVHALWRTLATDMVQEFAFGGCIDTINEKSDSFHSDFQDAFDATAAIRIHGRYNPIFKYAFQNLPPYFANLLDKRAILSRRFEGVASKALKAREERAAKEGKSGAESEAPIIIDLLQGQLRKDEQKIECVSLLFAGSDTTAFTMSTGTFHVLKNPKIEERLVKAIDEAYEFRSELTVHDLENIPYLQAVVKESLRHAMPVPGRLPRIVPPTSSGLPPLVVDGKNIPPGSSVGLSAWTMHYDESIWGPDAHEFTPDRWLESSEKTKHLDSYIFTFGKGTRNCIGMHLAEAEIYSGFAYIFRNYKMTLKTQELVKSDWFVTAFADPIRVQFEKRR